MKNLKFLFAFLVYFAVLSCSGTFSTLPDGTTVSYFFDINSFYLDF